MSVDYVTKEFAVDFELLIEFTKSPLTNDRTLAIVFTGYIEKYLGELIQYRMPGLNSKLRKKLFDPDGLLGPLSAKIDIAKVLQSIDDDAAENMKLIASIRNRFAHDLRISSFDHSDISTRVRKLRTDHLWKNLDAETAKKMRDAVSGYTNRGLFEVVAINICIGLHNVHHSLKN